MKNSNVIVSAVGGVVAGVAIATLVFWGMKGGDAGQKTSSLNSAAAPDKSASASTGTTSQATSTTVQTNVVRKTVQPAAVERVASRKLKGQFDLNGRGADANWGFASTANFKYTVNMIVDSKIEGKKVFSGGEIKVTEIRTFTLVRDSLVASDVDLKLSLETVPVKAFSKAVDGIATVWGSLSGDVVGAELAKVAKDQAISCLQEFDGKGIRYYLGMLGLQPTKDVEDTLNKLTEAKIRRATSMLRGISGKSYKISYYQSKTGQPMYLSFEYADGSPVTDEQESRVIRRVNAFLDSNFVPDKDCRPGDTWKVAASEIEELFDPYVDGSYKGEIEATRQADENDGNWNVSFAPSKIAVRTPTGRTTGEINLKSGYAHVNPDTLCVKDVFAKGTARMECLTKHHMLFTARIDGECTFEGRVVTDAEE